MTEMLMTAVMHDTPRGGVTGRVTGSAVRSEPQFQTRSTVMPATFIVSFLMDKLHYANELANLLCNITNELVGLWQDQPPTSCTTCWALVLPQPNISTGQNPASWPISWQLVGQLVRIKEFGHKKPTVTAKHKTQHIDLDLFTGVCST
jgi:hypothetical protein